MSGWDWNSIYLTCFGVGLALTLVSFLAGGLHLHVGHIRFHGPMKAHGHVSPLNGFTLMAFLCWFGGAGYLLHRANLFGAAMVLLCSALSGLIGGSLVFWFLVGVLMPAEKTLEVADTEIVGVTGKLSCAVQRGGTGELLYTQNGARRSAIVRSEDGGEIERGAEVIVMRHERGVAYVRRWDEFEHGLMIDAPRLEEKSRKG